MEALPLPDHPVLRRAAEGLERKRHAAEVLDASWRVAYLTRDYLLACGTTPEAAAPGIGEPVYSQRTLAIRDPWPGWATAESWLAFMRRLLPGIAHDLPGGIEEVREHAARELLDSLADLVPAPAESLILDRGDIKFGYRTTPFLTIGTRLLAADATPAGTAFVVTPAVSGAAMSLLATADHGALERLLEVTRPARRPGAILFADLEGSSALSRKLPAGEYFRLIRRLMTRADDEIVDRGGLVSKHAGDGVTALFLAGQCGSESAAARACVETARAIAARTADVAARSGLEPADVVVRFGLHWGATLYVGGLLTRGRTDATALGDEMNEAARIEACASGGRALASKALVERLDPDDAAALGLRVAALRFTQLSELTNATEKARRDAPSLAVCDVR